MESLVAPNKQIAKGFETVMLATDDGRIHSGVVQNETDEAISLITDEGTIVQIDPETVEGRRGGKSAMPEDLKDHLTMFDLRDLVEFLVQLK